MLYIPLELKYHVYCMKYDSIDTTIHLMALIKLFFWKSKRKMHKFDEKLSWIPFLSDNNHIEKTFEVNNVLVAELGQRLWTRKSLFPKEFEIDFSMIWIMFFTLPIIEIFILQISIVLLLNIQHDANFLPWRRIWRRWMMLESSDRKPWHDNGLLDT